MQSMNQAPAIPSRARLLVVDDEPVNVQALYGALCDEHVVLAATNGAKALEMCRTHRPDLVLLDVEMPHMTGHEVCELLKADPTTRDIPVIFVTGRTTPEAETHVFSIGAVDFIAKPVNPAVVRARVRTHLILKQQSDLLRQMAFVDGLTGAFNRRYFDTRLEQECLRAARSRLPLTLVIADVDCFKAFNDSYGHQAGDDCLRAVARQMMTSLARPADLVARYGGEEFACILPETDARGASAVAMRLESRIRSLGIPHANSTCHRIVTISLGVASAFPGDGCDVHRIVGMADDALYRAKAAGRARAFFGEHEVTDVLLAREGAPVAGQPVAAKRVLRTVR
jgi:diguanylate cyclase (GGDEF)-like protein